MIESLALVAFAALLAGAAYSDVATMTIPNWVSIVLAALFPIVALATGAPFTQVGIHLLFGFGVLAVGFFLFQAGIIGGGDAKLIAAAAVWTGLTAFTAFAVWTAVAGGVLALTLLIVRKLAQPAEDRPAFVNRLLKAKGGVPYGVAILAGGLMVLNALPFSASSALTLP